MVGSQNELPDGDAVWGLLVSRWTSDRCSRLFSDISLMDGASRS
jgi:hypothetical protein